METNDLKTRVAALERKLSMAQQPEKRSGRPSLASEIDEVENLIAMSYMDDEKADFEDFGEEDIDFEAPTMVDEEIEIGMDEDDEFGMDEDDEIGMGEEIEFVDGEDDEFVDGEDVDIEMGMGDEDDSEFGMFASEAKPGIEDEITQDSLQEVEEEAHGTELTTGNSMLDVAPTKRQAAKEYVARLVKASTRLDRVASYLEKQGRIELAGRIDKIADAIDVRADATRRA